MVTNDKKLRLMLELRSSTIICPNLREFEQVIVRDHLWNLPDQIKIKLFNHLLCKGYKIAGL
jgi:hypothetical protein